MWVRIDWEKFDLKEDFVSVNIRVLELEFKFEYDDKEIVFLKK